VPLLTTPSILLPLLTLDEHRPTRTLPSAPERPQLTRPTPALELYLSRAYALALLALAAVSLLLSGVLPLSSTTASPSDDDPPPSPHRTAAALLTTLHHFAAAFLAYAAWQTSGLTAVALGAVVGGALAAAGTLCLVFAGEGRTSERTGRDKRASGMLFGGKRRWEKDIELKELKKR
jgi:hypothetical protein